MEELELTNGEKIDVILLKRQDADPERSREILFEIAELPIEGEMAGFSGRDHDEILYPTS